MCGLLQRVNLESSRLTSMLRLFRYNENVPWHEAASGASIASQMWCEVSFINQLSSLRAIAMLIDRFPPRGHPFSNAFTMNSCIMSLSRFFPNKNMLLIQPIPCHLLSEVKLNTANRQSSILHQESSHRSDKTRPTRQTVSSTSNIH